MDKFQIETAQNVNIVQNAAGVGDRILAYLLDVLILVIYSIVVTLAFGAVDFDDDIFWLFGLAIGLPIFLYHLLWETFWDGRSPGKAVMKLRVVMLDGSKPAFSNYLLRWLIRIIDVTITFGALALVTIFMNGRGQRLGDIAATTTVITEKKTISLAQTILMDLPEDYTPRYPQVTVFTDAEIQTIKNVYMQARYNGNHNVILKLADKVSSVMEITYEEKPLLFLQKVVEDYNYFTQQM